MSSRSEAVFDVAACRTHLQARQEQQFRAREERRLAALKTLRVAAHSVLPRFPRVRRAYLFGSVLRPGALRSTSDVDVAFEGDLNAEEYFALWRALERAAPDWVIDLVDLSRDVRFADLIRERGELVYGRPDSDAESEHPG
jgi:predicted nucleotidyltransferase